MNNKYVVFVDNEYYMEGTWDECIEVQARFYADVEFNGICEIVPKIW